MTKKSSVLSTYNQRFSWIEVETAVCLWEAYLDAENAAWTKAKDEGTEVITPAYLNQRGEIGSYALRHAVMGLVRGVDKLWARFPPDTLIFDWEFCPLVIAHGIDWGTLRANGTVELHKDAYERIHAHYALQEKFGEAA